MKTVIAALFSLCLGSFLSGCSLLFDNVVDRSNAKACGGLPDAARRNCLQRRGADTIYYEPAPIKLDPPARR